MAETRDLLVEIGTEELPPKALSNLSKAFTDGIVDELARLDLAHSAVRSFATPRRLALVIEAVVTSQPDKQLERKGPAVTAAYDAEGKPTKAAEGFARSCGVEVSHLEVQETAKGAWLVHRQIEPGQKTLSLIPDMVEKSLAALPIPKRMRWGSRNEEFVRPVHWILMLFGDEVVPGEVMGQAPQRTTRGHRFHHPIEIPVAHASDYARLLKEQGRVIADFDERKNLIADLVKQTASDSQAKAVIDPALLNEVASLTEWPVPILGSFEERFLEIPSECLVQAMQSHQKYFPVVNNDGELLPHFITISNIESLEPEQVRSGNERVIRPRFNDAAFFWRKDLSHPLEHHIESLKTIKFQDKLGSLHDKCGRIAALSDFIAEQIGLDKALAMRAAWLCKCDLMSEMVGEFPNLQGIMGRYYAQHSDEHPQVAQAMEEVYLPRHAGDSLPQTACGQTIAIADRLDTLLGIFAIGQQPSGAKDPYGLRRATLGVLRILIETPLDLDLKQLLNQAAEGLSAKLNAQGHVDKVFEYMMERLKAYYTDQDFPADSIEAVLALRPTRPADLNQRVRAVSEFRKLAEAESLAAANKRIRNILKKNDEPYPDEYDPTLLQENAEQALADQVDVMTPKVTPLFEAGEYTQGLLLLAGLKQTVDDFFDQVMVMTDTQALRLNRLALLSQLEKLFLSVADLSRLHQA